MSVLLALVLGALIALFIFGWIILSPKIFVQFSGLSWSGFNFFKIYLRLPETRIDFRAVYMEKRSHFSLDDPHFAREAMGSIIWGARLGVAVENCRIRLSSSRMKILVKIGRVSVFYNIRPDAFMSESKPTSSGFKKVLLRLLELLISVEVERIDAVVTLSPDVPSAFDSLFFVDARVDDLGLFKDLDHLSLEKRPPFTVPKLTITVGEYCTKTFEPLLDNRHVLATVSHLTLGIAFTDDSLRFDIFFVGMEAELIVSDLLLVSSIVHMVEDAQKSFKKKKAEFNRTHSRKLFNIKSSSLNISCQLPDVRDTLNPIQSLKLSLVAPAFHFIVDGPSFSYVGFAEAITFGAFFADNPDVRCFTKCDRILQRIPRGDVEHTLISLHDLLISNSQKLRESTRMQVLPKDSVRALMTSLLAGNVNWDHLKNFTDIGHSGQMPLISEWAKLQEPLEFLLFSDFSPTSAIMNLSKLEFSVPFEFPLSSLIERLAVMVKAPIMMFKPGVKAQSFDLFSTKWEILLSCPRVDWTFGDDPFESKLNKIFAVRQKTYQRALRLEKMFLKRLGDLNLEGLSESDSKAHLVDSSLAISKSKEFKDLFGGNVMLITKYCALQERLFDMYLKAIAKYEADPSVGLMDIQISDVDLKLKWSPEYLGERGIHDLLNAIENSTSGYTKEMTDKFSLFLGAVLEFSGRDLNVYLRDFQSEFVSVSQFQICGPIFLLEEGPYPEACVVVPVSTGCISGKSNICSEFVLVSETVLPVKFFHSLGTRLSGSYGFKAAFCPYWDGMFVGLDRAFDMLSKPTSDKSPRLEIWDKLRLLAHSTFGYMFSESPCYFSFYPGKANSSSESLVIQLLRGFSFELTPEKYIFEFEEFEGLVQSHGLSVLRRLLETRVPQLMTVHCQDSVKLLKLIHFAKTKFILDLNSLNCDGKIPIQHQQLQMSAEVPENLLGVYDAYKDFRLHSIITSLAIVTDDELKSDVTALFLYDELIDWVKMNLLGYTKTCVRRGPLFASPFIIVETEGKNSIVSIVDEIHFKFHFRGAFSCLYLNFFDSENYGGLHLSSTETRIALDYAKSRAPEDTASLDAKWVYYFGEVDFKNVNLDVISSDSATQIWTERFRAPSQIRLLPASIIAIQSVSSPRLFYTCNDSLCFAHDPKASVAQDKTLKIRSEEKLAKIAQLEETDSDSSELSILKEQYRLVCGDTDGRQIEKHFYFIYEAKLYWHKGLRNAVYHFVDQQFVRHMIRSSKSRTTLDAIRAMGLDRVRSPSHSPPPNSPRLPKTGSFADSSEDVRQFYENLMKRSSTMYAAKEDVDAEQDALAPVDIRSPQEIVVEANGQLCLDKLTEIFFYSAQLLIADDDGRSAAVTAPIASVEIGSLLDPLGPVDQRHVGSRTKVSLESMCIFVSDGMSWTTVSNYEKITEPTSAAFVFNSKQPHYSGALDLSPIGLNRGNTLTVYAPELDLFMSSTQYTFIQNLISDLLVYRDPGQHDRAEQLEALVLASDILDKSAIIESAESLQIRVHGLEMALAELTFEDRVTDDRFQQRIEQLVTLSEELGLIVESMMTIKSSKEKWGKKQTRLQLDVNVDQIELTMLRADKNPMIALTLRQIKDVWVSDEDFSMSNSLEIGVILAMNKTPDSFYKTLIEPLPQGFYQASGIGLGLSDQTLRIYWKTLIPVGGIPIIEHAELNLAPLTIQLSYELAAEATKFFLPDKPVKPGKDLQGADFELIQGSELGPQRKPSTLTREASLRGKTKSLSRMESMDEILSMKQKASNNCSFVSIRVPATQHFISYKV